MVECPTCKRMTLRETAERFDAQGHEQSVWECTAPDCGYGEGRATGRPTPAGVASQFAARASRRQQPSRAGGPAS